MFRKLLLILTCFILTFSFSISAFAEESLEKQRQHYLKIEYDNKVIFHEEVPEGKLIQIENADGEILESEVLKQEQTIELDKPESPKGFMLSYWDIKDEEKHLIITPILTEVKAVNITFNALEGGELIENNAQTKVITKSIDEGTLLNEIIPETNPNKNHKLSGWYLQTEDDKYEEIKEIDTLKVSNNKEYFAQFYPDINDNNIDDRTEEINIKFVYSDDKSEEKSISIGQSIELPKPERKDHIFMGWFYDKDFKEKFSYQDQLIDDTVLYAKWEKAEKVVQESAEKPITEKEISDQVEKYLNGRLQGIEEQLSQSPPPQENTNSDEPKDNESKDSESKDSESKDSESKDNKNNSNNANDDGNLTIGELEPPIVESNNQDNQSNQSNQENKENEVLKYTEEKYVFKNDNIGERYMVKFFDENDSFIFSLTLPYGRTIHLLHENENLVKEYAVRQDTTINLRINDYINKDSDFIGFNSRTIKENNSYITEVFPEVSYHQPPPNVSVSDETVSGNDNNLIAIVAIVAIFISIIGLIIYFILRRRKNKSDVVNVN